MQLCRDRFVAVWRQRFSENIFLEISKTERNHEEAFVFSYFFTSERNVQPSDRKELKKNHCIDGLYFFTYPGPD